MKSLARITAILTLPLIASAAIAQSTTFTYQGDLKQSGTPVSGLFDMGFRLFDGATDIGYNCIDNVLVTDGKFSVRLDFAHQISSNSQKMLEIEVRADVSTPCTDPTGYAVLWPRQTITPTPLAIQAETCANANVAMVAFTASLAAAANSLQPQDGSPVNAVFVDSVGRVGIGTTTPGHTVTIANVQPTLALQDTDSSGAAGGQQVGYISYRDGINVERGWVGYGSIGDPDFSIVNARPSGDIVLNPIAGNVGIGTSSPAARLDVRGDIVFGNSGQYAPVATNEAIRLCRGFVSPTGTRLFGSGFTASRPSTGVYNITFDSAFIGSPVITACVDFESTTVIAMIDSVTSNSAVVRLRNLSDSPVNAPFNLIAIGPR